MNQTACTVRSSVIAFLFGASVLLSSPAKAQTNPDPLDKDEFLGQISMGYLQDGFQDRVDEFSGHLYINAVDLRLPGNAGMEIVIQRNYSSNIWNRVDNYALYTRHTASVDPGGRLGNGGWQLHLGKIIDPFAVAPSRPTLVMPDGSTHPLFSRAGYPGQKITQEGWIYTVSGGIHQVTLTDGAVYYFDQNATGAQYMQHDGSLTPVIQCTRIEDAADTNGIDITYSWEDALPPYHLSRIDSIAFDDTSDNRTVDFYYHTGTNRIDYVKVMNGATELQHWGYSYSASPQTVVLQGDATSVPVYAFTGLTPPEGDSWDFEYYSDTSVPGDGRFMLEKATMPSGGNTTFTYAATQFDTGSETCVAEHYPQFAAVQTRTVNDRDATQIGVWTYSYSNPGLEGATTTTTVSDGVGVVRTEERVFHGWGTYQATDPNMWKVGLLKSSTISEKASLTSNLQVTTETTIWQQGDSISSDFRQSSLWTSCASGRQWTGVFYSKPTNITTKVERTDSDPVSEYTAIQSNFDNWRNPGTILEAGDVARIGEIDYWQDTTHNIKVGRISARDQDPGGTECFKYDSYGRLEKHFVNPASDGVSACGVTTPAGARQTSFSYDSNGNLYRKIAENGSLDHQTTFTNYAFGQAQNIQVENGSNDILYCKEINPLGTVAWETDGRGANCSTSTYRTNYGYDDLNRLILITPPTTSPTTGLPTNFTYLDDWSSVTVTRGTYDIQYRFDGLGRLEESEDLETKHKVVLEYDPLGTRRQATIWYDNDPGDTILYDAIGRPRSVTHPDTDSIEFAFDGSIITETDEESRSTVYYFEAFGHPDDRRLWKLIDANGKTTEYGYDTVFGFLNLVDAPIVRGDRSFSYYSGQSNGWNGLLETETHPETGTTTYEYDRLGKTLKRTRSSEDTDYVYDRAGRLTDIDFPGTGYDVALDHDNAGNRTLLYNPSGTVTLSYDAAGRLEWKESSIDVNGQLQAFQIDYEYDGMDRVSNITYPSNREIQYDYDGQSRLESVDEPSPSTNDFISAITYHSTGTPDLTTFGNGVTTDIGLDGRYRVETMTTLSGPTTLMEVDLGYDGVSNVETWTDYRNNDNNRSFTYDSLSRLRTATAGAMWGNLSFTYDDLGNRLTRTLNGATTTYNYSAANNRLLSLTGAETATFDYDDQGRQTDSTTVDISPPPNVSNLSAISLTDRSIRISWSLPNPPADTHVVKGIMKTSGFPKSLQDGDLKCIVYVLKSESRALCDVAGLTTGATHFFTFYTRDDNGNTSSGTTFSFVPDTCTECDQDLMIGNANADSIGVQNTGALGVSPPEWERYDYWDIQQPSARTAYARPALADLDNDTDKDMVVGLSDGTIAVYENTRNWWSPVWTENTNWAHSYDIGTRMSPALADLDGDGDLDIFAGNGNGQVEAYKNNGDAENPGPWAVETSWSIGLPSFGLNAAPVLGDLDDDGLVDLIMGTGNGTCEVFKNIGSKAAPEWARITGWDIPTTGQDDAVPALADLDADGDLDVVVGDAYDNRCYAFENTGSPSGPSWTREQTWDVQLAENNLTPTFGELDREQPELLFMDGFETGDTSIWHETTAKIYRPKSRRLRSSTHKALKGEISSESNLSRRRNGSGKQRSPEMPRRQPKNQKSRADDLFSYTFNAADQLTQTSWQHGTIETYSYDGDNLRIKKIDGSEEVIYIRDAAGNVLAEYDETGALLAEYIYANGQQVAKIENQGEIRYLHADHLGTALVITDEAGIQTWRGEYFPFGEEYSSNGTPNRYRFTQRETDQNTGLSYMRARYYNPHLGRFLTVDPVGGKVGNSQSWNRYAYVENNPVRFIDPTGNEIYEKAHRVAPALKGGKYHMAVLIVPRDQGRYKGDKRFKTNPETGQRFATLGAGPEGGYGPYKERLVSGSNRERDADLSLTKELIEIDLDGREENEVIEALFAADANYQDNLEYDLFPQQHDRQRWFRADDGYNSNPYFRGLLEAVGLNAIRPFVDVPGFDKPVPKEYFSARE